MTLDDLPSYFNSQPLHETVSLGTYFDLKRTFKNDFITSLVGFCHANNLEAAMVSAGRPMLGTKEDNILIISDRQFMEFEFDDLIKELSSDEMDNDLSLAGKSETEEFALLDGDIQVPFKQVVSFEPGFPKAVYVRILAQSKIAEMVVARDIDNPFSGRHDGSFFEYPGFLTEAKFDEALHWATEHRASDVTVQPGRPVFARIGSEYLPITLTPVNTDEVDKIVRHIYGPSGPAEILGGYALDPAHEIFIKKIGRIRFRVNITGGRARGGSSSEISLRTLPTIPIKLDHLNLEPELIKAAINSKDGLVLFTGPTGSGKSMTMSSLVRHAMEQATADLKIIEYSAPIEFIYDDIIAPHATIWQTEAGQHIKNFNRESIFALCVANGMRRNPDIIIIGESRDTDTMQNTLSASQSGHLVLSTMHTTSVASTVRRAVNMFPENVRPQMSIDIMEQLRLICTQRLLPRVGGGRVAVREFMVFGEEIREMFIKEPVDNWPRLVRRLFAEERAVGQSMAKHALRLLRQGLISKEDYVKTAARGVDF